MTSTLSPSGDQGGLRNVQMREDTGSGVTHVLSIHVHPLIRNLKSVTLQFLLFRHFSYSLMLTCNTCTDIYSSKSRNSS
jgi:hypothetical protein